MQPAEDFLCVILPDCELASLPPGYRYVLMMGTRCRQPIPESVERWVVADTSWTMSQWNDEIRALHEQYNFKRIVFDGETGILPAVIMNDILGLGGFTYDTALAFRDKGVMYTRMAAAGVSVPEFRVAESIVDFYAFARSNGYPFLIKPTLGESAKGITKIGSLDQLHQFCRRTPSTVPGGRNMNLMCSQLIDVKKTYHTNGVVQGRNLRCCYPCVYFEDILKSFASTKPLTFYGSDQTVHKEDPMFAKLVDFTARVTEAYDVAGELSYVYHLEVMRDMDDNLFFCETTCRVGGDVTSILEGVGIDFHARVILGQLGIVANDGVVLTSVAEQPSLDKTIAMVLFGINRGYSLQMYHELNLDGLSLRPECVRCRPFPFTHSLLSNENDGDTGTGSIAYTEALVQVFRLESDSPSKSAANISALFKRLEEATVLTKI